MRRVQHICWLDQRHDFNPDGRCFVCETELFGRLLDKASAPGVQLSEEVENDGDQHEDTRE